MRVLRGAALGAIVPLVALSVVACSGTASSTPAGASASATSAASSAPAGSAASACAESTDTATVEVTIVEFAFDPATVEAAVGDVIEWSNGDSAPHSAVVDGNACATATLQNGQSGALVFSEAGTYAYVCGIHSAMKGTIEVSG